MNQHSGFKAIDSKISFMPNDFRLKILERLAELSNYVPVIGIMGKTGAGKSSFCNALFQGEVSPVSDVSSCTREALYFRLQTGTHYLTLVDLPGVGEDRKHDKEYESLYRQLLPELDLIVWIIKADDRAMANDEYFYKNVLGADFQSKVIFVINQADKIEPCHEWSLDKNQPSSLQTINLEQKNQNITRLLQPKNPVCHVSVKTGWNLTKMVETMVECLPEKSSSPFSSQLHRHLRTERVKEMAKNDFGSTVGGILDVVASLPAVPMPMKSLIHQIRDAVVSLARSVWDFFF